MMEVSGYIMSDEKMLNEDHANIVRAAGLLSTCDDR
jgi:hypothetical protein